MKISHEFEVERPIERVWETFQDVPTVAQCLPGASITEEKGDNVYAGAVEVKLGPMNAKFEGEATVTPDHSNHSGSIIGKGVDRSGGSRGSVDVEYRLAGIGGHTRVFVEADIKLSGAVAQFGRTGLIEEMSRRLIDELVYCLHSKLDAATPEEAATIEAGDVKGIGLLFSSLVSWIGSLVKRLLGRVRKTAP
ncbi:MAG: SRPBCC family protein [Acidimicrobiia bacterium]|nr:SRPBCC family protein [Acidimicrobiia bacterium]NND14632.1 SRPBCC family protein [Acidimicrobiia bacterium]